MNKLNSMASYATLSICHMAGMIDLAALPLWVGSLMNFYGLTAPQAGLVVTTFLVGVMAASATFAPRFSRLPHRIVVPGGFAVSACAFLVASWLKAPAVDVYPFLLLHAVAGFGAGAALSVTHGTIGLTSNPHRLFGVVNVTLGVLAIPMFAVLPGLIATLGGQVLFQGMAATMALAALVSLAMFPKLRPPVAADGVASRETVRQPLPRSAWLLILTIICLTLNQSTVFSFVERIGMDNGFGMERVQLILVVMGFVNLMPGVLAAVLQKRLSPIAVGVAGPLLQAVCALSMTGSTAFASYAVPAVLYVSLVIFTHTFLFGLMSRIDTTGRAVAATPAMMMFGSAMGPVLGGMIVAAVGYRGLGLSVTCFAAIGITAVLLVRRDLARTAAKPAMAAA